jgi:hypothetical protein
MQERQLPASDARYRALKNYVAQKGGLRLSMHGGLRDQLVEAVVEEWPVGCSASRVDEVVRARVARRLRTKYGGLLSSFVISVLANLVIRLVVEWWLDRNSHRVLMEGWSRRAQKAEDLPATE